jgi:NAD(P)H dehydrogenase (quinone)
MGTPYPVYEQSGMIEALKKTSDTGIFVFSGMTVARHCFFGGVPSVDDATRKGYLEEARSIVRGI